MKTGHMTVDMERRFVSLRDVAAMLQTCPRTVARMVQRGALPRPVILSARCQRFDLAEVLACLEKAKGTT